MTRWVLHVDLDEFLAAVEVLRRPELAGRPVVVGGRGDPTERGVVSTASYPAREHGVRSGMPLRVAARRCPDAVFLPVDKPVYETASAGVMAALRALRWDDAPVDVEVLGWDEAFLARRSGRPDQLDSRPAAERFAAHVRAEVLRATRLHCSVGAGQTKVQAKTATGFAKPRGVAVLTDDTWFPTMGARPVTALWGIGPRSAPRLAEMEIRTVAELATADVAMLAGAFGPTTGPWLRRLGRGADTGPVDPSPWVPRAHGREETFQTDLDDDADIERAVRDLAARAAADLADEGRPAARVVLKVRDSAFHTVTRSRTLPEPTGDAHRLGDVAIGLLARVERRRPVRLLGVRLEMVPPADG